MTEWAGHGPDSLSMTWLDDAEKRWASEIEPMVDGIEASDIDRLIKVARAAEAFLADLDFAYPVLDEEDVTERRRVLRSLLSGETPE